MTTKRVSVTPRGKKLSPAARTNLREAATLDQEASAVLETHSPYRIRIESRLVKALAALPELECQVLRRVLTDFVEEARIMVEDVLVEGPIRESLPLRLTYCARTDTVCALIVKLWERDQNAYTLVRLLIENDNLRHKRDRILAAVRRVSQREEDNKKRPGLPASPAPLPGGMSKGRLLLRVINDNFGQEMFDVASCATVTQSTFPQIFTNPNIVRDHLATLARDYGWLVRFAAADSKKLHYQMTERGAVCAREAINTALPPSS